MYGDSDSLRALQGHPVMERLAAFRGQVNKQLNLLEDQAEEMHSNVDGAGLLTAGA